MAATSIIEFDSTLQEFAAHWNVVNTTIAPAGPFVLLGNYTRDQFLAAQATLVTASNDVIAKENGVTTATGYLETRRNALRPRVTQFNTSVRGLLAGTGFDNSLPRSPTLGTSQALFTKTLEDMRQLWQTINGVGGTVPGFTPPLTLAGGYTLEMLTTDIAALSAQAKLRDNAAKDAQVSRSRRNVLLPPLRARMVEYRKRLPAIVGMDSPLVASMPKITPKPGSTPDAPNLSARWDATAGRAAGDVASFKVYALTGTGNEKGSLAVVVRRPG